MSGITVFFAFRFPHRMEWLQQGSRELFGTIIEDEVYLT